MTGPDESGPSGIFGHLDDPGAPAPSADVLSSVVHRGRRLRARRQGAFAMTGAVAVTAAVLAGLGLSHAFNAEGGHDRLLPPASSGTPTASASAKASQHHRSGDSLVVPQGPQPASPIASLPPPTPTPSTPPCEEPSADPTPTPGGVLVPPLVPTASPEPVCGTTPSPSESPSPTESPTPSESETPTPTPTSS